ncbi:MULTISPECIES: HlyD family type I secretion periplasmic adaptor subunit [unclassified Aminobacter]|uniref:HlyD family type I secretion periplasmic adaptor subunit n=1 Tax=unclassified Aminobacter TaxID=2644704 RepID=UPI000463F4D1|nr:MULTISPECIES: HlyD family type I secretion periplasmic adaptor subunit [unclassified Aminobacter]TWG49605.1 HlyD family secretion protein [Aminobacter sp. J44]TWH24462.1 HlyD family secretion protein [Aminobacter sp. J15]
MSHQVEPNAGKEQREIPVATEFQSDSIEIERRPPPVVSRVTLYGLTLLIISAVTWASLSQMDEIVTAQGELVTTQPTIIIQPLETSIIRSLDVKPGDLVRKGQTLATLDPTFSEADFNQKRARHATLNAQIARLEAELSGTDYAGIAENSTEAQHEVELFRQRRAFYDAQMRNFDEQIATQQAALESSRNEEAVLVARRDNLGRIEDARKALYERETGSLLNLLGSRDARLDVDANLSRVTGAAMVASRTLAKLQADRQVFIEDYRRATMEQLSELRSEREGVREELKKMELRHNMVALSSPADAVVLQTADRSIGSVVKDAEPLMTLVPLDVPLEAEVYIHPRDIARVDKGSLARIKFDAFPFQKYGAAHGSVRTVSHGTFAKPGAQPAESAPHQFRAHVEVDSSLLKSPGGDAPVLLPGMTVTTEIKVGQRSVISYFLYPLIKGLDESIREP